MKTFIAATLFAFAYAEEEAAAASAEEPAAEAAATEEITYPAVYAKTAWTGPAITTGTSEQVLSGHWWTVQSEENVYTLHVHGEVKVFAFGSGSVPVTAASFFELQEKPDEELEASIQQAQAYYDAFFVEQPYDGEA